MHKIASVHVWSEDLNLSRPYTIAFRTINSVQAFYVLLRLEDGTYGVGSGNPSKLVTGEDFDISLRRMQAELPAQLIGADIRALPAVSYRLGKLWANSPAARAAIDIALHDLHTKRLGIPLLDYFGRAVPDLPTSITIGIKDTLEETLEEAREYLDRNFRHIKLKIGKDPVADAQTCHELMALIGKDAYVRVDGNQGYTAEDLDHFVNATTDLALELIEQPLPVGQTDEMRRLPANLRTLSAADEDLLSTDDAFDLACTPVPFGIFNIKLMKCGGPAAGRRIGQTAAHAGIQLMWGCNDESPISIAAALHTALSMPNTKFIDLDGSLDLADTLAEGGFSISNGIMSILPDRPGLGVSMSKSVLEKYA